MVGDIFWARLPLTDLSLGVPRPALVVADVGMRDWVVCRITGNPVARRGDIAIGTNDLETGRLPRNSWVRPGRLFTVEASVFESLLGRADRQKLSEVLAAIRNLF